MTRRFGAPRVGMPRDDAAASLVGTIIVVAVSVALAAAAYVALSGFGAPPAVEGMAVRSVPDRCGGTYLEVLAAPSGMRWNDLVVQVTDATEYRIDHLGVGSEDAPWSGAALQSEALVSPTDRVRVAFHDTAAGFIEVVHVPSKAIVARAELRDGPRDEDSPAAAFSGVPGQMRGLGSVNATASDSGCSGVDEVEVAVFRATDGLYWNGVAFASAAPVWMAAGEAAGAWSFPLSGVALANNQSYGVITRATDAAGNTQPVMASTSIVYLANASTQTSGYYTTDGTPAGATLWEPLVLAPGFSANLSFTQLQQTSAGQAINENTAVFTVRVKSEDGQVLWIAKIHRQQSGPNNRIVVDAWDRNTAADPNQQHVHSQNAVDWGSNLDLFAQDWLLNEAIDEHDGPLTIEFDHGGLAQGGWNITARDSR